MENEDITSYYGYNAKEVVRKFTQETRDTAEIMADMGKFVEYMDTTDTTNVYQMIRLTRTFPIRHLKVDLSKFYDTGSHRFLSYLNLRHATKLTILNCDVQLHPTPPGICALDVEASLDISPFAWAFKNNNIKYLRQTNGRITEDDLSNIARRTNPITHLYCEKVDLVNKHGGYWRAAMQRITCLELNNCATHPEYMTHQGDVHQYAKYEKYPGNFDLNETTSSRDPRTHKYDRLTS